MITVFNRRIVYQGTSLEKQARVRERLNDAAIRYTWRVVNMDGRGRTDATPFVPNTPLEEGRMYYIYVHKSDYERATAIAFQK